MISTKPSLNIGDRIEASGEVTQLSNPNATRPRTMSVLFPGSATPIVIDAVWANRAPETLQVGTFVQLRGRLTGIDRSPEKHRVIGVVQLDGHPYELTLPLRDLAKLSTPAPDGEMDA